MGSGVSLENGTVRTHDFRIDVGTDIMGRKRNVRFCFRSGGRPTWETFAAVIKHQYTKEMAAQALPLAFEIDQVQLHDTDTNNWVDMFGSLQKVKNRSQVFVFQPETGHGDGGARVALPPAVGEAMVLSVTSNNIVLDYTLDFKLHYIFHHVDKASKRYVLLGEVHALLASSSIETRYEEVARWFARLSPKASGRLSYQTWTRFGKEHPALVEEIFRFTLEPRPATGAPSAPAEARPDTTHSRKAEALSRAVHTEDVATTWAGLTEGSARKSFFVKDLKTLLGATRSAELLRTHAILRRDPATEVAWEEWWRVCHNDPALVQDVLARLAAGGGGGGGAAAGRRSPEAAPQPQPSAAALSSDILDAWDYLLQGTHRTAGSAAAYSKRTRAATTQSRFDSCIVMRELQALLRLEGYRGPSSVRNPSAVTARRGSDTVTWGDWCRICRAEPQVAALVLKRAPPRSPRHTTTSPPPPPHTHHHHAARGTRTYDADLKNGMTDTIAGTLWNAVARGEASVRVVDIEKYLDDASGWWSGWEADLRHDTSGPSASTLLREEVLTQLGQADTLAWKGWWLACTRLSRTTADWLRRTTQQRQRILETMAEHVWKTSAVGDAGTPVLPAAAIAGCTASRRTLSWAEWWRHALSHPLELNATYTRTLSGQPSAPRSVSPTRRPGTPPRHDLEELDLAHHHGAERVWQELCPAPGETPSIRDVYLMLHREGLPWDRSVAGPLFNPLALDSSGRLIGAGGAVTQEQFRAFFAGLPAAAARRLESAAAWHTTTGGPRAQSAGHPPSPRAGPTPPPPQAQPGPSPAAERLWGRLVAGSGGDYFHRRDLHALMAGVGVPWTPGTAGALYDPAALDSGMRIIGTGGQVDRWEFEEFAREKPRVVEAIAPRHLHHPHAAPPQQQAWDLRDGGAAPTRATPQHDGAPPSAAPPRQRRLAAELWGHLMQAVGSAGAAGALPASMLRAVLRELGVAWTAAAVGGHILRAGEGGGGGSISRGAFDSFVELNESLAEKILDAVNVGRIDLGVTAAAAAAAPPPPQPPSATPTARHASAHLSSDRLWQHLAKGRGHVFLRDVFTAYSAAGIPWRATTLPAGWYDETAIDRRGGGGDVIFLGTGPTLRRADIDSLAQGFPEIAAMLLQGVGGGGGGVGSGASPLRDATPSADPGLATPLQRLSAASPHATLSDEVWRAMSQGHPSVTRRELQASFRRSGVPWTHDSAGNLYADPGSGVGGAVSKGDWDTFAASHPRVVWGLSDTLVQSISFTPGPPVGGSAVGVGGPSVEALPPSPKGGVGRDAPLRSSDADVAWDRLSNGKPYVLKRELLVAMQRVGIPWAEETLSGLGCQEGRGATPRSPGHVRRGDWVRFTECHPRVVAKLASPPSATEDMDFVWGHLTGGGPSEMSTYTAVMELIRKSGASHGPQVVSFFFPSSQASSRSKSDRDPLVTHSEWREFCFMFPAILKSLCGYVTQL